jgi:hypothetical protein
MRKMVIDLFLTDAEGPRELPSTVLPAGKQDYDLLSNGLHDSRLFRVILIQEGFPDAFSGVPAIGFFS